MDKLLSELRSTADWLASSGVTSELLPIAEFRNTSVADRVNAVAVLLAQLHDLRSLESMNIEGPSGHMPMQPGQLARSMLAKVLSGAIPLQVLEDT
jgi:hypothetical protein